MADDTGKRSDFLLYTTPDGDVRIEVFFEDETVWLTQKRMAELFGVESHTITYHLGEIFDAGELEETPTTRKIRVVQNEGERKVEREVKFYNLDATISVGYRVNSQQATQFRIWATNTLRSFMLLSKTNFIGQFMGRPQQSLSPLGQMPPRRIWA